MDTTTRSRALLVLALDDAQERLLALDDAQERYLALLGRGAILSAEVEDITILCLRQEIARIDEALGLPSTH